MKRKPVDLFLRETIRWEPENGFMRIDQHMRRLTRSADALGFRAPVDPIKQLKPFVSGTIPLAVYIKMNHRGELDVTTEAIHPTAKNTVLRIKIAEKSRLDSTDTFFRHKTTRRDPYIAARLEYPVKDIDEVLLLNERGDLCEGSETSIFLPNDTGILLTPPLDCGSLPGVLRAELIRERKAIGKVIRPDALIDKQFYVGNSLKGLMPAILV